MKEKKKERRNKWINIRKGKRKKNYNTFTTKESSHTTNLGFFFSSFWSRLELEELFEAYHNEKILLKGTNSKPLHCKKKKQFQFFLLGDGVWASTKNRHLQNLSPWTSKSQYSADMGSVNDVLTVRKIANMKKKKRNNFLFLVFHEL